MSRVEAAGSMTLVLLALLAAPATSAAASRMTGRVVDGETQQPIANAEVELANTSGGQGFYRARSNGRGEFAIEGISPDRWYALTVGAQGYADFVVGAWQFPAAQRGLDLLIPLDRASAIDVRVVRSDGRTAVAGARAQLVSERGANWWEGSRPPPAPVFTDRSGVARFGGLTAGSWTVLIESPGLMNAELRRIAVQRGKTSTVPVRMVRPASVSGVVRLADGTGVAGLTVTARGPGEAVATTGADGEFTVAQLGPGKYRLEVTHEGFEPTAARETITLREGAAAESGAITVTPRAPELAFVLQREAFLPDAPVKLGLRSYRVGAIELTLFQIPTAVVLDPGRDFRRLATDADTSGLRRVAAWEHATVAGPEWSWREEEMQLPERVPAGVYLLRGRAGSLERRTLFFVTDLGLIAKRSPTELLISAGSLSDGRPVEGARLFVIGRPATPGASDWTMALAESRRDAGVTDERGLALVPDAGRASRVRVVAVSERRGLSVVDVPLAPAAEQGGDKAFLYTDRPIYRPGQTAHWKLFARKARSDGYALPDATTAAVWLIGPDGSRRDGGRRALSSHGSADGTIDLPRDLPLGDWTLNASAGSAIASATLAVQEYRKPEFQVEVTPDREIYVNGDEVRFRIAASYFFGAPVFGATLRYNLFESRLRRGDEWEPESEEAPGGGYGRVLKTGETRTDLDGRAVIAFTPERVAYDRRLTLEVEVVDPSSRVVSARGEAIMGRGLFTIALRPVARVLAVGQPIAVEVVTRDHAGKPVSAAVTIELDQEAWNPIERRYTRASRPLAVTSVTTDREGRARAALAPALARSGSLTLRARGEDSKGNRITAESSVWVYDARLATYAYRYPSLEALTDQPRYQPGDTARVLVNTDARDAVVLASIEGRELYERRVVLIDGQTAVLSFPIRPEYAPNVFVSIMVRKGKEVHARQVELAVEAVRHDLVIGLVADRERYRPGDSARVAIETRDHAGAPLAAEVSVGVVDEAIYSLRADRTPDPHDVFYGRRPNWVATVISFPVLYYGGADKGGREEVRRDFRDVAFWAPSVQTGADGRATVGFRYPDNLTTWRITSRGATHETQVGKAVAKTLVTKDVVARLAGPRQFVAGDEAALVAVVTNRTGAPLQGVEQSIEVEGAAAGVGTKSARVNVAAGGEARSEWRVAIPPTIEDENADARLTFRARSRADSDALEVRVPVRARAVPMFARGGGRIDGPRHAGTLALPSDLVRVGSQVTLDLAPSTAAMALSAMDYLHQYPYGCAEQTANGVLPAAALMRVMRTAGARPAGWEAPERRIRPYIDRLIALQGGTGGWGWWQESEPDPYLTALALDALARAQGLGIESAAEGAIQRAVYALPRLLAEVRTADGEAYVLAHLGNVLALESVRNMAPGLKEQLEQIALNVFASRARLATSGLALAVRAHVALGRPNEARTLMAALTDRAQRDATGLHWPADPGFEDAWFGEEVENTAYALSALVALDPRDAGAAEIVRWLATRRTGPYWRSTRVTGPVVEALADYLASRPDETRPRYRLRVEWNGENVLDREITADDVFSAHPIRVLLAGERLRAGENRFAITREGQGSLYYAFESRAQVPSPGPSTAAETRLAITREYLRAERTADRRGRPRYLANAIPPGEPIHVGESVLVRLTLRAAERLDHLVIEDPRPAGFEIEALLPEGADWPWGAHGEERDDRAVFFLQRLDEGETRIEYLARPEIAGRFSALPAAATGMYRPELLVRSGQERITVEGIR